MLVDRTGESGRLCWPTARAEDSESCGNHPGAVDSLTGAARMWHTPKAHENAETSGTVVGRNADRGAHCFSGLGAQTAMWRTPQVQDPEWDRMSDEAIDKNMTNPKTQLMLQSQAAMWPNYQTRLPNETSNEYWERMTAYETEIGINPAEGGMHWPTPQARDVKSPDMEGSGNYERKMENGWTIDLNSAAANWPTPATRDWKSGEASEETLNRNAKPLSEIASHFSLPDPPTSTHGGRSLSGYTRRLNPDFVDWLMGLIPGWTDYAPLETASYLCKVRSLLRSYLGGRAE